MGRDSNHLSSYDATAPVASALKRDSNKWVHFPSSDRPPTEATNSCLTVFFSPTLSFSVSHPSMFAAITRKYFLILSSPQSSQTNRHWIKSVSQSASLIVRICNPFSERRRQSKAPLLFYVSLWGIHVFLICWDNFETSIGIKSHSRSDELFLKSSCDMLEILHVPIGCYTTLVM